MLDQTNQLIRSPGCTRMYLTWDRLFPPALSVRYCIDAQVLKASLLGSDLSKISSAVSATAFHCMYLYNSTICLQIWGLSLNILMLATVQYNTDTLIMSGSFFQQENNEEGRNSHRHTCCWALNTSWAGGEKVLFCSRSNLSVSAPQIKMIFSQVHV